MRRRWEMVWANEIQLVLQSVDINLILTTWLNASRLYGGVVVEHTTVSLLLQPGVSINRHPIV